MNTMDTFDAPGGLAAALSELRYRARVVVERDDGTPLSEHDEVVVQAMLDAAARELPDPGPMRDAAATAHFARARERNRAAAATEPAPPADPKAA